MFPSQALSQHRAQIREIALSRRVSDVRVFGSALHGNASEGSDLDLLTPNRLPPKCRDQVLREAVAV